MGRAAGDRGRGAMAESAPAHPGDRPLGQGAGVLMKGAILTGHPVGAPRVLRAKVTLWRCVPGSNPNIGKGGYRFPADRGGRNRRPSS